MPPKLESLTDQQLATLIENRWKSSETVWDVVLKTYPINYGYYRGKPDWLETLPRRQPKVRTNRIFTNTEAVINTLIANPPKPTILSGRDTPSSRELASSQERYFGRRYDDLNVKEVIRKGLRNLYLGRIIVLKPFWDSKINDFNVRTVDPRKIRVQKNSTKEEDSEFAIEEVEDSLLSIIRRFPKKQDDIMRESGFQDMTTIMINNPQATYKEAWIRDRVIFKYNNIILDNIPNPYWDWDGIAITEEEENQLSEVEGDARRSLFAQIKAAQPERQAQQPEQAQEATDSMPAAPGATDPTLPNPQETAVAGAQSAQQPPTEPSTPEEIAAAAAKAGVQSNASGQTGPLPLEEYSETPISYRSYYFNHFNHPRKAYIWATIFNNENTPIGATDMITQAIPLQVDADETKRNITRNARFVNGVWKIDAGVMGKSDAQRIDTEVGGVLWGKNIREGATREAGQALPAFVFENYQDSLNEIDNIMAASSAFRGEREGATETKGGILALIDQNNLRLNELVQVVDYVNYELFNWFYQLAKVRYTEHHYAKVMGDDDAEQLLTIVQDDLLDGTEVRVIAGKTLPEDRAFRYQQAQEDIKEGIISPITYLQTAGYENPQQTAKDAYLYKVAPQSVLGITDKERAQIPPPIPQTQLREQIAFDDLPDAAKVQFLARMGITIQPEDLQSTGDSPISIAFKDLPLDGQIQAAAKAGITLNPAVIVAEKMAENRSNQQQMQLKNQAKQPSSTKTE